MCACASSDVCYRAEEEAAERDLRIAAIQKQIFDNEARLRQQQVCYTPLFVSVHSLGVMRNGKVATQRSWCCVSVVLRLRCSHVTDVVML